MVTTKSFGQINQNQEVTIRYPKSQTNFSNVGCTWWYNITTLGCLHMLHNDFNCMRLLKTWGKLFKIQDERCRTKQKIEWQKTVTINLDANYFNFPGKTNWGEDDSINT